MRSNSLLKFRKINSEKDPGYGYLTPIQYPDEIPFAIKRVYYIYGTKSNRKRGSHAHKKLHQILICINGSVKIYLESADGKKEVVLNDPSKGLYVGPGNWREMSEFSDGAVLLVLASEKYDESDYIRDYDEFVKYIKKQEK